MAFTKHNLSPVRGVRDTLQTQTKTGVYLQPPGFYGYSHQTEASLAATSSRNEPCVNVPRKSPAIEGKGGRVCLQGFCPASWNTRSCNCVCLSLFVSICSLWKWGLRFLPNQICRWADSKPASPALAMVRCCPPENADASVSEQVTVRAERWQADVYCLSSILQGDGAGREGRDSADDLSSRCSRVREGCSFCISMLQSLQQSGWYNTMKSVRWVWGVNPDLLFLLD